MRKLCVENEGKPVSLHLEVNYMEHDDTVVALGVSPLDRSRVVTAGWDGMYAAVQTEERCGPAAVPDAQHQHSFASLGVPG